MVVEAAPLKNVAITTATNKELHNINSSASVTDALQNVLEPYFRNLRNVCSVTVQPGLAFEASTVASEEINLQTLPVVDGKIYNEAEGNKFPFLPLGQKTSALNEAKSFPPTNVP